MHGENCIKKEQQDLTLKRLRVKKKTNNKFSKNKNFTAVTDYLSFKAPSNNVKMQSDKTLTTPIYFYLNYTADGKFY